MKNEQEKFWSGSFGNNYIKRNNSNELVDCNKNFFKTVFKNKKISQCLEIGSNIGLNLIALKKIFPDIDRYAIEINKKAIEILKKKEKKIKTFHGSLLENFPNNWPLQFELVFTKTVLIHIAPRDLNRTYKKIYSLSKKYILICEYYNPVPVKVVYRNFKNKLFKRDFAGDLIKKYDDLSIIDYGFIYRNDPYFPQDDVTWFLLKKNTK